MDTHLIILVHGINTRAKWTNDIKSALRKAGFVVEATSYGKFGVPRFLLPFGWLRKGAIERVSRAITTATALHRPTKTSIISHSFGTFVIANILADHPEFVWERIIFCGSVVRDDFRLDLNLHRFRQPLLNEVGTRDYLPALAESVTWGYGSVGSNGYNAVGVETRWHQGYRHSDFLTESFCTKYWVPFIRDGTIVEGDQSTDLPWWIRVITGLPLRWLQPVLVVAVALLAATLIPSDPLAKSSETQQSHVNAFTLHRPGESFEPGDRLWSRPVKDRWIEMYPSGFSTAFDIVRRTSVDGCDGSIVASQRETTLELLIPDKGCAQMVLKFRRRSQKWIDRILRSDLKWNDLAIMNKIE
jgi:pimeloyl-ACP methyl ester carboxylesterase